MRQLRPLIVLLVTAHGGCGDGVAPIPRTLPEEILISGFRLVAATSVDRQDGGDIVQTLTVENTLTVSGTFLISQFCPVQLRVFRSAGRLEPAAWDARRTGLICPAAGLVLDLSPGERAVFESRTSMAEVLGDSLPPGHYYFSGVARHQAGADELQAGEGDLGG